MSLQTHLDRIRFIDDLIRRRATGDLESLSKKLQLSKSHTTQVIKEMKEVGFPIEYSRKLKAYYYKEEGMLVKHLFEKYEFENDKKENKLSDSNLKKILGGKSFINYFFHSDYIRMNENSFV